MFAPGLDTGPGKESKYKVHYGDNWRNLNVDCGLDNIIVSLLNFLILVINLLHYKICLLSIYIDILRGKDAQYLQCTL